MQLRFSTRTDIGRSREQNEDAYGIGEGEGADRFGALFVLCDGAGGHPGGEVASQLAVDAIRSTYYDDDSEDRSAALMEAFAAANVAIYAQGRGMLTTAVAALLYHGTLYVANVGDSRAYGIRDAAIRQITRDHSVVSEQVAAGLLTADQARSVPFKNLITRALGSEAEVEVDIFRSPVQAGDVVVLACDGLYGLLTDAEISQIVTTESVDDAVNHLVDLANQRGGPDNITVIVVRVVAPDCVTTTG